MVTVVTKTETETTSLSVGSRSDCLTLFVMHGSRRTKVTKYNKIYIEAVKLTYTGFCGIIIITIL